VPQALTGQETREDSPSSQPDERPVDTQPSQPDASGAAVDRLASSDPPPPPGDAPPPRDEPSRDDSGRFAPKTDAEPSPPDPIKAAIDRLAKKPNPEAAKQPAGTPAKAAPKPLDGAKPPATQATDEALKTPTDDLDAPPEEKAAWRQHTKDRFEKVLSAARTHRQELADAKPDIESGRGYNQILEDFDLKQDIGFVPPEHFAGVVKAQAAVNRALIAMNQGRSPAPQDVETFTALASNIDTLRTKLGIASTSTPAPAPQLAPFTGQLPGDMQDLVDVYGIPEERVRILAALEASGKQAPPATAQPTAPPVQVQQPPAQPARQSGVDMDQLYGRKLLSEMSASGVQNPTEQMRVLLRHPATKQEVVRRFPGVTVAEVPQVFDALDAATRYEILKAAHTATTAKPVPARPSQPPPAATTQRTLTATRNGPGATQGPGSASAVDDAINLLANG
jgi:hypothetical protein